MLGHALFENALPYAEFLSQYGTPSDQARWDAQLAKVTFTDDQRELLRSFTRECHLLVLAGAWCGDCAKAGPLLEACAALAPVLRVRYLDRDAHPEVQAELKINGGDRVPVLVIFSEDGHEVLRFGERTLTEYRRAVQAELPKLLRGAKILSAEETHAAIVADWMHELERAQWILRLSPRLRRLHAD